MVSFLLSTELHNKAKSGWLLKIHFFVLCTLRFLTQEMSVGKRRENTNHRALYHDHDLFETSAFTCHRKADSAPGGSQNLAVVRCASCSEQSFALCPCTALCCCWHLKAHGSGRAASLSGSPADGAFRRCAHRILGFLLHN